MSELFKNDRCDYSVFDTMSSEALEEILRADAQQLDDERNLDAVLYITELLEKRTAAEGGYTFDPKEHMPDFAALLKDAAKEPTSGSVKTPKKGKRVLRTALVAAVICVLIFALSGVATAALGVNIWNSIGAWTDEVFGFWLVEDAAPAEDQAVSKDGPEQNELQQALDACGITEFCAPTYLPEGYVMDELIVDTESVNRFVYARYTAPDGTLISFCADEFSSAPGTVYEKTADPVETLVCGDTVYYVFSNINNNTVAWISGKYECSVVGATSREELKQIAVSMFGKE